MTPRRRPWLVLAASIGLALLLGGATWRMTERGKAVARDSAEAEVAQSARVAAEWLQRELRQVEATLALLVELEARALPGVGGARPLGQLPPALQGPGRLARNLAVLDEEGQPRRALRPPPPIDPTQVPPSGTRVVPGSGHAAPILLLHRPDGAGLIGLAEIAPEALAALLGPLTGPRATSLTVETQAGARLAAGGAAPREGEARLGGQAPLEDAGLVIVAERPLASALADWQALATQARLAGLALGVLVLALGCALFQVLRLREAAHREREAAARRLAAAVESLPGSFVLWDASARLVLSNSRFRALFGGEAEGLTPGIGREEAAALIARRGLIRGGPLPFATGAGSEPVEIELTDGRWLLATERRLPDGDTVWVANEVTALKRANAALQAARDEAERAMAAKSRLLAHVSHELRTPLGGLLRLSETLAQEGRLPDGARRQAGMVGATARHLLALANEVLDLAALDAAKLELHPEPSCPAALLDDAVAMIEPLAEARRLKLVQRRGPLPAMAQLDATRVRQVLLNLLSNAVKFSPEGGEVALHAEAHGGRLHLVVTDQGPGIPPAERDRLFTEFARLRPAAGEGTGLGLSVSARLVELMGGEIGCDAPRPGVGGSFRVSLPLPEAAMPAPAPAVTTGRRLRLLAVDDSRANLSVLRALLATTGFELVTHDDARAGLEALDAAWREGRPFDAVLMDVMMPGMDGLEATRRIRARPGALGRVPVIAVTAGVFPDDVAACRAAGMSGHVPKPVERSALLRAIAQAVAPEPEPEADEIAALRPLFLAELSARMQQLDAALACGEGLLEPVHAISGTVGHLGEDELVAQARAALRALRGGQADAPALVAALREALGARFPALPAALAA